MIYRMSRGHWLTRPLHTLPLSGSHSKLQFAGCNEDEHFARPFAGGLGQNVSHGVCNPRTILQ